MAGQRGVDGDVGGLAVADLADHDDVRVLAQDVPQARGEGQPDLRVDLDLVDRRRSWYSTGSSMVMIFLSGEVDALSRAA